MWIDLKTSSKRTLHHPYSTLKPSSLGILTFSSYLYIRIFRILEDVRDSKVQLSFVLDPISLISPKSKHSIVAIQQC